MIELLFVVCISGEVGSSQVCEEKSLLFTDVTPMTCMMGAQPVLAKWIESHPAFTIRSWMCKPVSFIERDA
ncbi:hypothetical protein [uncultured Mameliella sp.]|jgi:hypothetical protein|uniref:hypothetical protein n=1 Tax=uncultured Mameliella sp. TaxID=1447087 RepID=UPI0026220251|nr:hypothetical protein [uncultured Mameliella sp.]